MIKIEQVDFTYQGNTRQILSHVNLQIEESESVGIIGSNGVGKSTLLKLLVGLELGYQGIVQIQGMDVTKENLSRIRQIVGFVFQDSDSQLFMPTIYEDVAFAPRNYGYSEAEVLDRTMKALECVGIEELKDTPIYHLSGGQKKLASIATVLSMEPKVLIFDEPTVALDPKNRRRFIHTLNELQTTKVITSHDLDLIYDTCERTILIGEDGSIVWDGNTKEILQDQKLLEEHGLELPLSFSRM